MTIYQTPSCPVCSEYHNDCIDLARLERAMTAVLRDDGAAAGLCELDAEAVVAAYNADRFNRTMLLPPASGDAFQEDAPDV